MDDSKLWAHSPEINEIAKALAAFQAKAPTLVKDKTAKVKSSKANYEYTYGDLAGALDAVRDLLKECGLAVTQLTIGGPQNPAVVTMLMHGESGQWIRTELCIPGGGTPQAIGSALTYARRYALLPMLGLATEDDDGASARRGLQEQQRNAAENRQREEDDAAKVMHDELPDCTTGDDLKAWWKRAGTMDVRHGLKEAFSDHVRGLGYQPKAAATKGELVPLGGDKAAA